MTIERKINELEKQLQILMDIEAIKQLKAKYLRCVDSKLWSEIRSCFADDLTTSLADGELSFNSADDLIDYFVNNMVETEITMHHCHTPEITLTSETTAEGIWALHDYVIAQDVDLCVQGAAFYKESYVKQNGRWLIKDIGYKRVFEERWAQSSENKTITKSMHTIKGKR
ncbi:nuclear transport factor 2 family protein [Massilibacteroides sp.]|uniref:nuclear transport factor 2 family protein n=1 Tax=Massilibacteroides sp. TaxID=2034766 RepID=UPI0026115DAC|nr:nuclear transport factor 2 family protein [Massilibacteroides sp.]MDD4516166.1 nuclear transport factor 2 family protein [Massilibacteroides sp.]